MYLNLEYEEMREHCRAEGRPVSREDLREAVMRGAGLRLRPIVMTAITLFAGLLPIMLGGGVGSDIMQRIVAPMVGGVFSTLVLTLLMLPAVYFLWGRRGLADS